jgi:hypothetical protein
VRCELIAVGGELLIHGFEAFSVLAARGRNPYNVNNRYATKTRIGSMFTMVFSHFGILQL